MDQKEERKIEHNVKKEQATDTNGEKLYAGIANGIPNEKDNENDVDALNANFAGGQGLKGSHTTNINTQTDLELGASLTPAV